MNNLIKPILLSTLKDFTREFLQSPYLCYTEHGLHALFFQRLYENLPQTARYITLNGQRACRIQKEYRTCTNLGRSKRQNWDVAVLATPTEETAYDYAPLLGVVEFGLNEAMAHLIDDIERLSHKEAQVDLKLVAHFHRLSNGSKRFSERDWSEQSKRLVSSEQFIDICAKNKIAGVYAFTDLENPEKNIAVYIDDSGKTEQIK